MNFILNLSVLRILNFKLLINPKIFLIGVALLLTTTQSLKAQEVVHFPDANLEKVIRAIIGKPEGDIFDTDLLIITDLYAASKNIANLTGLEYCINLHDLRLSNNQISNLDPLSGLNKLLVLYLNENQISNLSSLSGLTELQYLYLYTNYQISDLSPLIGLNKLQRLRLSYNQISDLSPLSELTELRELWLSRNQISNLSPLRGLNKLLVLVLDKNQISNLSPLSGLNKLVTLSLNVNQISDLSPLSELTELQYLYLYINQISDLSPLSGLNKLQYLYLDNNQISDLSPLIGLNKLQRLDLPYNQISNISPLLSNTGLGEWNYVDLRDNPLNDEAYDTHIPALQERGVGVLFDPKPEKVPQITVNLAPIAFGEVLVGEEVSITVSIGNTGNADLNVTDITHNLGPILTVSEISFTVAPGATSEITLTLTASDKGEINGTLTIASNDPNSPTAIDVSATAYPTGPKTIYVSTTGNDTNDGLTWATAKWTIQAGIDIASNGDTVLVADGTYTGEGNKDLDFGGKAITVTSENGSDNCIIDCEGSYSGFYFHSGETSESVVSGFTITNGYGSYGGYGGGGISCYSSSPMIQNNKIIGNFGTGGGGGISCYSSSPIIQSNEIIGNSGDLYGGGIYCRENSSPTIQNNKIYENSAEYDGGGIFCLENSFPVVLNTILWANNPCEINVDGSSEINITYSTIQGGWEGKSNIDADPLFVDAANGDYHLSDGSSCIGAGTSDGAPTTDIEGNTRGMPPDMGAYENPLDAPLSPPSIAVTPSPITFGAILVDEAGTITVSIGNTGDTGLSVTDITSNLSTILDVSDTSFTVASGATHEITLTLTPTTKGEMDGTLTIISNDPNSPSEIAISANALKGTRIIAVKGSVFMADKVTLAPNGFTVTVNNLTHDTVPEEGISLTGDDGNGRYATIFTDITDNKIQAVAGDEIEVVVTGSEGNVYGAVHYIYTSADAESTVTRIDVITTLGMNHPPVLNFTPKPPYSIDEGKTLTINVTADDSDGDEVTITHSDLPENCTFADDTLTFNPSQTQAGEYSITFTADDGNDRKDTQTINITVIKANVAPQLLSVGGKEVIKGQTLSFVVNEQQSLELVIEAYDEDGDTLSYSMDCPLECTALDENVLQWIPNDAVPVTAKAVIFNVFASDGELIDSAVVEITLTHIDQTASVVVAADPQSLPVKTTSNITVTLKDSDGNPVTDELVTLQANTGSITSPANHTSDGVYVAEYTAGETPGIVTVTAKTSIGKSGETKLTVTEGGIAKLFISQPPSEIHAGAAHQFTISGEDAYGNAVNVKNTDVTWQVTDGIGKIDNNGLFTATTVGQGTVTATLKVQPNIAAETETFSVLAGPLAAIAISPAPSEMRAGETHQFTVSGKDDYENDVIVRNTGVTWEVIGGIGSIDEQGVFTAKTVGRGNVKATLIENITITAETQAIQVTAGDIASLEISEAPETMQAGETHQFGLSGEDSYGNDVSVPNTDVTWSIIGDIGGIDENGLFTAKTVGSGKIKAILKADENITAETKALLVTPGKIATIVISEAPSQMRTGETYQFNLNGKDAYGNDVEIQNTDVIWEVAGGIGNIDENGLFTAKTIGEGKVEASLKENLAITAETKTILVTASAIASLIISEAPEKMQAGETHQFNLSAKDAFGNSVDVENTDASWEVLNGIGSIDENGLFTAEVVGEGEVRAILRTDTNITVETGTIQVVLGKPALLEISPVVEEVKACETIQFTISGEDAYGNDVIVQNTDVTWQVIGNIGDIDESGLFTAGTVGSGEIKAILKTDTNITGETKTIFVTIGELFTFDISEPPKRTQACETHQFTIINGKDICGNDIDIQNSDIEDYCSR
ncbi:leucine-rich repeat domain-containing protein [bacterium]|nr:leucine-rich repeat domain-containing protein [bacterium]